MFITLRYLGHQVTNIQVSELFGFSLSTAHESIQKVVGALSDVAGRLIRWPKEEEEEVIKVEEDSPNSWHE